MEIFNCLRTEKNKPNKRNEAIIPRAVIIKLTLISLLSVFKTDRSLIDKTGNTQGIKLSINPPIIEINKIKIIDFELIRKFDTSSISTTLL